MRVSRLAPVVLILACLAALALAFVACGDSDSPDSNRRASDTPPANSASEDGPGQAPADEEATIEATSLSLSDLHDCVKVRSSDEALLTQGETDETRYGDELDADAPEAVVRQAIAYGGWLRLKYDYDRDNGREVQVGAMDVLDFGTVEAAKAGARAARAGRDEDGKPITDYNHVVRIDQLVFVYQNEYHEDRGGSGAVYGVIGTVQACLGKLGSTATLPKPKRVLDDPVE